MSLRHTIDMALGEVPQRVVHDICTNAFGEKANRRKGVQPFNPLTVLDPLVPLYPDLGLHSFKHGFNTCTVAERGEFGKATAGAGVLIVIALLEKSKELVCAAK